MAVLRNQDFFTTSVTLAAGVAQQVLLARPRTLPAQNDTIDFVIAPSTRRDWEAGMLIIDLSSLAAATVLRRVEFIRDADSPFTEAPEPAGSAAEPLFPSGAPAPQLTRIAYDDAVGESVTNTALVAYLANLTINAGEQVRLTLFSGGGDGPVNLRHSYDLGRNKTDITLRG